LISPTKLQLICNTTKYFFTFSADIFCHIKRKMYLCKEKIYVAGRATQVAGRATQVAGAAT
jgi:hypothetical protein